MKKKINIILDHNQDTSITRIAVMYANNLVKNGYEVTINYPIFSWYRHKLFLNKNLAKFYVQLMWTAATRFHRRKWIGKKNYKLEKDIKFNTYLYKPTKYNISDADYILIFQNQLLLDLVDFPKEKGEIIDSLWTSDFIEDNELGDWFKYLLECSSKRISVKRFASSSFVKDFFCKYGVRVDRVIYSGVNLEEFKPNNYSDKTKDILMFCDAKKAKGFDFGISVLKELKKKNIELKFYSIGRNTEGLDTSIFDHVYGSLSCEEYATVYQKHLFFLYPSLYDGFPAPPLEAMASGAVCILSKVAGVDEYAVDRENCMLCEPGNLEEFVRKTIQVIQDQPLCEKISKNAIQTAQRFSWENSTKQLIKFMNGKNK